ncbi:MAG: TraR/DksA family transcriptional regulator [Deltaproteobacteria bacterium]|nr:TraR/DksA family transcriptional regulator [Deltaproteobacteria bacterium]
MQYLKHEFFKSIVTEKISEFNGYSKSTQYLSEPADHPVELVDQAAVETDRRLFVELRKRQDNRLRELKDALERIENGTYGTCMECKEDIPVQRLMARPTTILCVGCQEAREKSHNLRSTVM